MNEQTLRRYLLNKRASREDYPFGKDVAVFKIRNKMFALLSQHQGHTSVNLKCDPQQAIMLRDVFDAVLPGYHMNKQHWNTVLLDGSIINGEIERMVDHSYALVVKGLPKKQRIALEVEFGPEQLYCG